LCLFQGEQTFMPAFAVDIAGSVTPEMRIAKHKQLLTDA
jgi:hypothetical protein